MIVGQEKLLKKVEKSNLDTFPQSLILLGDKGCGKHTLCNFIAQHLNIEMVMLDSKLEKEDIEEIINRPYPTLYIIEATNLSTKFQNSLLKTLEEPFTGSYFIIICENLTSLLPTLVNRCHQWVFQTYNKETLRQFININDDELLLNIATTPGQILEYQEYPLQDIVKLVNNILERITTTSPSTLLTITDRIAFKDEKDKFNLAIFLKVFRYILLDNIKNSNDNKFVLIYNELLGLEKKLNNTISQVRTFENFLIKVWEVSR